MVRKIEASLCVLDIKSLIQNWELIQLLEELGGKGGEVHHCRGRKAAPEGQRDCLKGQRS